LGVAAVPGPAVSTDVSRAWSPALVDFAARADYVCNENYFRMEAADHDSRAIGRERGWSPDEREAASWYATAEGMMRQYRELKALGKAPSLPGVMAEWIETSRERARLNKAQGYHWLYDPPRDRGNGYYELQLAQLKANLVAERLPFHTCGHDPANLWDPPLRAERRDARLVFVMPLAIEDMKLSQVGTPVYWHQQVAGRVTDLVRGSDHADVELRVDPEFAPHTAGGTFELIRTHDDRQPRAWTIVAWGHVDPVVPKPKVINIH
jgi:hypothetical protein